MTEPSLNFMVQPVTKANWSQFVELFGDKGACANCWCMYYRLSKADFNSGKINNGNKNLMKEIVWKGKPVGLLGFLNKKPVAWCAFAPREDFIKLEKSRVHKRIDDKKVWSIPCFFIHRDYRNSGISGLLLQGAIEYANSEGIKIIEAYPTITARERVPDSFAWIGFYKTFERTGFKIVDRTSKNRPMVRYYL